MSFLSERFMMFDCFLTAPVVGGFTTPQSLAMPPLLPFSPSLSRSLSLSLSFSLSRSFRSFFSFSFSRSSSSFMSARSACSSLLVIGDPNDKFRMLKAFDTLPPSPPTPPTPPLPLRLELLLPMVVSLLVKLFLLEEGEDVLDDALRLDSFAPF